MARDVNIVPVPDYPDIVPAHPELSDKELDRLIEEGIEKAKDFTEWPDILTTHPQRIGWFCIA